MGELERRNKIKWVAVAVWIILFTILVGYDHHRTSDLIRSNRDLIKHNAQVAKQHDTEIRASTKHSCEATYTTIYKVFKPFFPPKKARTIKQQKAVVQFTKLTDPKVHCIKQTKP